MKTAIIGAGIAGLSAARSLKARIRPHTHKRASRSRRLPCQKSSASASRARLLSNAARATRCPPPRYVAPSARQASPSPQEPSTPFLARLAAQASATIVMSAGRSSSRLLRVSHRTIRTRPHSTRHRIRMPPPPSSHQRRRRFSVLLHPPLPSTARPPVLEAAVR